MPTNCPACDYDLSGLPESATCPECGLQNPVHAIRFALDTLRKPTLVAAISAFALALFVYIAQPIIAAFIQPSNTLPIISHALISCPILVLFILSWWRLTGRIGPADRPLFRASTIAHASLILIAVAFFTRTFLRHIMMSPHRTTSGGSVQIQSTELVLLIIEIVVFLAFLCAASMRIEMLIRTAGGKFTTIIYALPVIPAIPLALCLCATYFAPPPILISATLLAITFYAQITLLPQPPHSPTPQPHQ